MEYKMNTPVLPEASPRILLIEDNPISREFLHEALKPLGLRIDVAETLAAACTIASRFQHNLFLCDVHLPDGGPEEIFTSLRQLQKNTMLVAVTADTSQAASALLNDTGYQEIWNKPIAMAILQNNVSRLLGMGHAKDNSGGAIGQWDEAAALRVLGGNEKTLRALREMFFSDLPRQRRIITQAFHANDPSSLKAECHKLLAACGFVGAAGLSHSVRQLSEMPDNSEKLNRFIQGVEACLASQNPDAS